MRSCDAVTIIVFSMSFLKPVFRKLLTALITLLFSYASLTLTLLSELYKDLLYTSTRFLIKFSCRLTRLTRLTRPTRLTRLDFKIAILWKWLWTFITWKRFLTSVGSDMNFNIAISWKWLWTLITWKRFLTSVGSSVNFQITILWKWLWTLITWKMFLTNVGFSMNFKMAILWKWLLTLVTKKSF